MKETSPYKVQNYKFFHHINTTETNSKQNEIQSKNCLGSNKIEEIRKTQITNPSLIKKQISITSEWIKTSKNIIVYTGGDLTKTKLQKKDFLNKSAFKKLENRINMMVNSKPIFCHHALCTLSKKNYLHQITTTNIDVTVFLMIKNF